MNDYLKKVAKKAINKAAIWPFSKNEPDLKKRLFSSVDDPQALKDYIRSKVGPEAEGFSQAGNIEELRNQATSELSNLNFRDLEELNRKLSLIHGISSSLDLTPEEIDVETQLALIHMLSQRSGLTPEAVILALKEEGSQDPAGPLLRSIYPSDLREQILGFPIPENMKGAQ